MSPTITLSNFEQLLLNHISEVGIESPVRLRVFFKSNRFKINQALQTLYKIGYINRDVQGLIIHRGWLDAHPAIKEFIEYTFKQRFD